MHNLGLGDLEFDPGHTVDQHRPDGYKVPEIVVEEDREHTDHTQIIKTEMKDLNDASKSNDGKTENTFIDKTISLHEPSPTEFLNTISWKSDDWEDTSFASLHNPKHVHHKPHPHGKCFMFVEVNCGNFIEKMLNKSTLLRPYDNKIIYSAF